VLSISSFAQTPDRRQTNPAAQPQEQASNVAVNAGSIEKVAVEIELLRKSVQTLNVKLSEISDKVFARDDSKGGSPNEQNRIVLNLDLLTRAEQRAELLRKQLFELIEKETSSKVRLVQIEEEMRPESIERALNPYGTTRTSELREARRRSLENERKGIDSLLNQIVQSRMRLEDDVKQADSMVFRLRQRLLPQIDKEIEKINPN
jgi:hypothetical protein